MKTYLCLRFPELLPLIQKGNHKKLYQTEDGNFYVKVWSARLEHLAKNPNCANCNIVSSYWKLQSQSDNYQLHYNL